MPRKFNFCAGPAALPTSVLQQAQEELLSFKGKGLSVMEMSHRSADFQQVADEAEASLRQLLNIPANYKVLFMQGGASMQFTLLPLNLGGGLAGKQAKADYITTGIWGKKAFEQAQTQLTAQLAANQQTNELGLIRVPSQAELKLSSDAAYLHYTSNETIGGVQFDYIPQSDAPLVCDMSSDILSAPLDVSKFGVIYAGAQKNIGPAGITLVIIREDLLELAQPNLPPMFSYKTFAENGSMYNTPPTFAWYLSGLVFKWLQEEIGGLEKMAEINQRKAAKLYAAIDSSDFYANPVAVENRSIMNIPFTLAEPKLEAEFLTQANAAGLLNLEGHRSVGGMRASLYNAVPEEGVDALVSFMQTFAQTNG